jgi:hypothetical protein
MTNFVNNRPDFCQNQVPGRLINKNLRIHDNKIIVEIPKAPQTLSAALVSCNFPPRRQLLLTIRDAQKHL